MSRHTIRTTVRLEAGLLNQARAGALANGTTLTALMEKGLRLAMGTEAVRRRRVILPVSKAMGGTLPGVDLSDHGAVLDLLDSTK